MDSEESLKGKFKLIQEQQQKKLLARTKRNVKRNSKKSAKDVSEQRSSLSMTTELKGAQSNAVWNLDDTCDDDLGLKVSSLCTQLFFALSEGFIVEISLTISTR